ncbi:MAG: hypothetical protein L3J31_04775 [Bacteroidales bacterium]|nr:hypothetical protein [Bacteroidales bacterium]
MKKPCLFLLIVVPLIFFGQEGKNFNIKFSGFVKTDIFYDSRQTVSVREGHFLLYPKNEYLDPDGADINAKSSFNMLNVQTRFRMLATGPDIWGAKISAFVEGAFFGSIDPNIDEFRLRHAYVKLAWPKTQLLIGQYWHPLFHVKCFPGTVSFNTGAPFQAFSRNPQIRVTQALGRFNLAFTVLTQRDFSSYGPNGVSSQYLRNSVLPALNLRFEYYAKNKEKGTQFLIGLMGNFKMLQPALQTNQGYKTNTKVSSVAFALYTKFETIYFSIKLYGFYGGDAFNHIMLGGYAIADYTDFSKGYVSYTPVNNGSAWLEAYYKGKTWQLGVFTGVTRNHGSQNVIYDLSIYTKSASSAEGQVFYSRGSNIDYVYRISPRLILNYGKFRVAPEIEYTVAAYATKSDNGLLNRDEYGIITDSKTVGNVRVLVGVYYFF